MENMFKMENMLVNVPKLGVFNIAKFGTVLYSDIKWRSCIGCLVYMGHFAQKISVINGSFAETDLQLKTFYASSPRCRTLSTMYALYVKVCRHTQPVCVCVCDVCVCVCVCVGMHMCVYIHMHRYMYA